LTARFGPIEREERNARWKSGAAKPCPIADFPERMLSSSGDISNLRRHLTSEPIAPMPKKQAAGLCHNAQRRIARPLFQ
jgi:hypothetical protein